MAISKQFQLIVNATRVLAECLSDDFFALGALSVSMIDAKDEPLFEIDLKEKPLWQHTIVTAIFDNTSAPAQIIQAIKNKKSAYQFLCFEMENIIEENWVAESQRHFHAQQFGQDFWVCPQWEREEIDIPQNHRVIYIEPGLAFGTGTHPTTQLCLEWLSNHPPIDLSVIDYGCGSGILALAAIALGAKKVFATDHDILALESTQNNARYNVFEKNSLEILKTDAVKENQAHLILANILANPLIELAPTLINLVFLNGELVLSGMLKNDVGRVFSAYCTHFELLKTETKEDWALMSLKRTR
ncbi:MAG: hypothetical protein ACD_29C00280G0003 [uncultured bacterium]|nr:MAG: hypothetical protein ACD_29C00280G0003 [uncultured bacterium]